MDKEEYGFVIHKIVGNGNVYVLGTNKFTPLELSVKKDHYVQLEERVYFGSDKRDKINNIVKWISEREFLKAGKTLVLNVIIKIILEKEAYFIDIINNNSEKEQFLKALQRALDIGPKTAEKIINARKEKPFESFEDIENRASTTVVLKKLANKIYDEIYGKDKFRIYANKAKYKE